MVRYAVINVKTYCQCQELFIGSSVTGAFPWGYFSIEFRKMIVFQQYFTVVAINNFPKCNSRTEQFIIKAFPEIQKKSCSTFVRRRHGHFPANVPCNTKHTDKNRKTPIFHQK